MAKGNNALRLADKYDLSDLEPEADREKAAAFLAGEPAIPAAAGQKKARSESRSPSNPTRHDTQRELTLPEPEPAKPDPWTSRTIRIRQSTATALTKAGCDQKRKQAEGTLKPGEPLTVQEIADHGLKLALAELGYAK